MPWDVANESSKLFTDHQTWISRKTKDSVLQSGSLELIYREGSECYIIRRHNENGDVALLINFSEDSQDLVSVMKQFDVKGNYSIYGNHAEQLPEVIEPGQYITFQIVQ
ncbi:hypothetical protein D3C78_1432850 [compost metagenome]